MGVLFSVQTFHAFTFAATHLAINQYITLKVPDQLTASAQTLYDSLALGAFMGFTITLAGSFYADIGSQVFWVMALISATAGGLLFWKRQSI